jgi:hypothetical protein
LKVTCAQRLRTLLRGLSEGLLASWLERELLREGYSQREMGKAFGNECVRRGDGDSARWRLLTDDERRRELEAASGVKRKSIGGIFVLRDPWADRPLRFASTAPRRPVNTCTGCGTPIGIRGLDEEHICTWCAYRREQAS